jgi:hypothetical protein
MPTGTQLFIAIFTGAVGTAYFIYGKKQGKVSAMLAGVGLCLYPYLVGETLASIAIGAALMAAPFFFEN